MKKIAIILSTFLFFIGTSCDQLENSGLSTEEVIEGLKTALSAGSDTSATKLHATDGYFGDAAVKILLPPEADPILDLIQSNTLASLALTPYMNDIVLSMNRAAEDAADEAKPIFINAISSMTIDEGLNILNGKTLGVADFDSTAATVFLQSRTTAQLTTAFSPYIDQSLNKKLIGDYSTNEIWQKLTEGYNLFVSTNQQIHGTLGEYATRKALDGMYFKVGLEEKKIRKDPFQWASDIIKKVFGYVYKES